MKRMSVALIAVAAFAAIMGLGLGCDAGKFYDAQLGVEVLAQPQGGLYVNTVASTVKVRVISDDKVLGDALEEPIQLKWAWHSPSGTYNDSSKVYMTMSSDDVLTMSKSAPSGMYLDKKFWLTLTWEDEAGNHTLTSDTADCRVN